MTAALSNTKNSWGLFFTGKYTSDKLQVSSNNDVNIITYLYQQISCPAEQYNKYVIVTQDVLPKISKSELLI